MPPPDRGRASASTSHRRWSWSCASWAIPARFVNGYLPGAPRRGRLLHRPAGRRFTPGWRSTSRASAGSASTPRPATSSSRFQQQPTEFDEGASRRLAGAGQQPGRPTAAASAVTAGEPQPIAGPGVAAGAGTIGGAGADPAGCWSRGPRARPARAGGARWPAPGPPAAPAESGRRPRVRPHRRPGDPPRSRAASLADRVRVRRQPRRGPAVGPAATSTSSRGRASRSAMAGATSRRSDALRPAAGLCAHQAGAPAASRARAWLARSRAALRSPPAWWTGQRRRGQRELSAGRGRRRARRGCGLGVGRARRRGRGR